MNIKIQLPAIFAIDEKQNKNSIQQLIEPKSLLEVMVEHYQKNRVKGYVLTSTNGSKEQILAIYNQTSPPEEFKKVLQVKHDDLVANNSEFVDLSGQKWIKHPKLSKVPKRRFDYEKRLKKVLDSWQGAFSYKTENKENGINGLRPPQIGAIHATHAHWAVTDKAATIVMPTGTGKTETMLSILTSKRCEKLLVVVPTNVLRTQIADKFTTLGILKDFGIVSSQGLYPIVGILNHKPKNCEDVDAFFEKGNVIVTTMQIAGLCDTDIQERMAFHCPYLFIDEAHHSPAKTWKKLKEKFDERRILQFTATPFRNDGKSIDGIIFNYPLRKAQDEGYFKTIHFKPVREYDPSKVDRAIAESAVKQLRKDLKKHDHIIMARVGEIKKAEKVFSIYEQYAKFNPVIIHSRMKLKERNEIRGKITRGESRIVVCVDMFGEGFDLPEMKIAALHDIRKSLAITLQLAGRFIRPREDLGDATFIANIVDVEEKLRELYSQNSDWNILLREASEQTIQEKIDLQELIAGFQNPLTDITLKNLRPAMSTVIYKTLCENWKPDNFVKGIYGSESFDRIEHTINTQEQTLVIVTGKKIPVDWAQSDKVFNWDWELYILFRDKVQNLLFIHSSDNNSYYEKLAEAVAGEVELIKGPPVFRCFHGINQLKFQNVGLIEHLGQLIRFTMRAGADIESGLTQIQMQRATKSNVFGIGYEHGNQTAIGCSYKGRIWSRRKANLDSLRKWCSAIGKKVLDETIDPEQVLKGTLTSKAISERPKKMPIGIEWPEIIYKEPERIFNFSINDEKFPLLQTDIELVAPSEKDDLRFKICSEEMQTKFNLILSENGHNFTPVGNENVAIEQPRKSTSLRDFFNKTPPKIWFVDGSSLTGNLYTELGRDFNPYPREEIQTWNWSGVNFKKESQRITKETDSIQYRVIRELEKNNHDIIFDDDGSGEIADVVCIGSSQSIIWVEFYHCKFSLEETPGARMDDLYTVCCQAQKSIHWIKNPSELFNRLLKRNATRETEKKVGRFERGNQDELEKIKEISRYIPMRLKISIVQPGLSKSRASAAQLGLLSVTQNYLMETRNVPFGVIASD